MWSWSWIKKKIIAWDLILVAHLGPISVRTKILKIPFLWSCSYMSIVYDMSTILTTSDYLISISSGYGYPYLLYTVVIFVTFLNVYPPQIIDFASTVGQMPVLHVNGKELSQSSAISRYLATKFDLLGTTDWDRARGDEVISLVFDLFHCKPTSNLVCVSV